MYKREMRRAVKRGAKLLDKEMPGWEDKIKLGKLDMQKGVQNDENSCGCIGAQIAHVDGFNYGSSVGWVSTIQRLFGTFSYPDAERNGFTLYTSSGFKNWDYLGELWKDEVRARKAA